MIQNIIWRHYVLLNTYADVAVCTKMSSQTITTLYNVCSVHGGGDAQYIGVYSVHLRDTISTLGGHHEYIGGCSVYQGDIMSTSGDFSASGDIMMHVGEYHEYIGVFNRN